MKPHRQRFAATLVLVGATLAGACDRPTAPTKDALTEQLSSPALQAGAQGDYVATPAGWWHRSCIHEVPSGSHLDRNGVVRRPNGTTFQIPRCQYPAFRGGTRPGAGPEPPTNNGWIEWADYQPGPSFHEIDAGWTVPAAPTGAYSAGQVYYTFPGLQSPHPWINQPVLAFGYSGSFWQVASWHCDTGPGCVHSAWINVTAGDALSGTVAASACVNGTCTWTITGVDVTTNTRTFYTVDDADNYSLAVGASVEVYGLTACNHSARAAGAIASATQNRPNAAARRMEFSFMTSPCVIFLIGNRLHSQPSHAYRPRCIPSYSIRTFRRHGYAFSLPGKGRPRGRSLTRT